MDKNTQPYDRLRKSWRIFVKGYDNPELFFAPTRGRAIKEARQSTSQQILWRDVRAIRAPESDVRLPLRHQLADEMTKEQTHCLLHSFGANENNPYKAGWRDYFFTRRNDPDLCALERLGLMRPKGSALCEDGEVYFIMTDLGKQVALSLVPEYAP